MTESEANFVLASRTNLANGSGFREYQSGKIKLTHLNGLLHKIIYEPYIDRNIRIGSSAFLNLKQYNIQPMPTLFEQNGRYFQIAGCHIRTR